MTKFLRIKMPGAGVLEIALDSILSYNIDYTDEGDYVLTVANLSMGYMIHIGSFDECHAKLNAIHDILPIEVFDL